MRSDAAEFEPRPTQIDHDAVVGLLRRVARDHLLPRFRSLDRGAVRDKGGGEIVTEADLAAERALASGLRAVAPGSLVVGEEAAHDRPELLHGVADHPCLWLVDPLDGTVHFARGRGPFGVTVALLRRGEVRAAWIHLPLADLDASGQVGGPVRVAGRAVRVPSPPALANMRGGLLTGFLPVELRRTVEAVTELERTDGQHRCAARRYVDLLLGREHFALYHRTLPWDHAAGAFLVERAGGIARRLDGGPYAPGDGGAGLLVAPDAESWRELHARLLPTVELRHSL